jgi:hypothetical protein
MPKSSKFAKYLGYTALTVGILVGLYKTLQYLVHSETESVRIDLQKIQNGLAPMLDRIAALEQGQKDTNARIDTTLNTVLSNAFKSGTKPTASQIQLGGKLLQLAKNQNITLQPQTVMNYGIHASALTTHPVTSASAWSALQQAADYRSFLNANYQPKLSDLTPSTGKEDYRQSIRVHLLGVDKGVGFLVANGGGHAPVEQSARLEQLDDPRPHGSGFGFFVVEGGIYGIQLDGMYMKNVIIRNAQVFYEGSATRLENVYFVNCTFHLTPGPPVRQLTEAILEAASVSFDTTKPS